MFRYSAMVIQATSAEQWKMSWNRNLALLLWHVHQGTICPCSKTFHLSVGVGATVFHIAERLQRLATII